jgi:hypothetical protein
MPGHFHPRSLSTISAGIGAPLVQASARLLADTRIHQISVDMGWLLK